MQETKRMQLEAKLKKMLEQFDRPQDKPKQSKPYCGSGNVIRRRKGEKEKRFSV